MIEMFAVMVVIGVAIGVFSGLLGIGGGTIMVPVFRLALGMSPVASTATSLFAIIPTSISGAITHIRRKTCMPKLGLAMGLGGACTSPLGAWLANVSPGWLVMAAAALVIGYSGVTMFRKAAAAPKAADNGADTPAETPGNSHPLTRFDLLKGAAIGLMAGVASGYIGLGGGFLMVPLMISLLDMPMRLTSGTSLVAVMILAVPGTVVQGVLGNIDYLAGIAMACGSIPGAYFGARLIKRIPERQLRLVFAAFLLVAAILLVVKESGVL